MVERFDILYAHLDRRKFLTLGGLGALAAIAAACGQEQPPIPEKQFREIWKHERLRYAFFADDAVYTQPRGYEGEQLIKIDIRTGNVIWERPNQTWVPTWHLHGKIYSGKEGHSCGARLDPNSGDAIWERCNFQSPVLYENEVIKVHPEEGPTFYVDAITGEDLVNYVLDPNIKAVPSSNYTDDYTMYYGDIKIELTHHIEAEGDPSGGIGPGRRTIRDLTAYQEILPTPTQPK